MNRILRQPRRQRPWHQALLDPLGHTGALALKGSDENVTRRSSQNILATLCADCANDPGAGAVRVSRWRGAQILWPLTHLAEVQQ